MSPRVLGLDPSLSATGYALPDGTTGRLRPGSRLGCERLIHLRDQVLVIATGLAGVLSVDLVAIEHYSYNSRDTHAHALGELGGVLRVALHEHGIAYLDVPPATLKKYATGRGNAGKEEVLASAIRRLGYAGHDNNESDALWLHAVGMALLGAPVVSLPQPHLQALVALRERAAA